MSEFTSNIENLTFGVEIETTIPAGTVAVGGYHAGVPVTLARTNGNVGCVVPVPTFNGNAWKAERDSSIRVQVAGHMACEFVSPVLKGEAGVRHLVEFVEFLRSVGAKVNASCGLHVHIGANGAAGGEELTEYINRLTRLSQFNSKALYAQTGTLSRERGAYCKPIGDRSKKAIAKARKTKAITDATATDRYQLLNLQNLTRRGTVEYRCFAGTLNTSKVLLHVFSALALCVIARTAKTPTNWERNQPLTGEKAVTNFLKVRPMWKIVSSPTFSEHYSRMIAKALEMAALYDQQQAALDALSLMRRGTTTQA